MRHRNVLAAVTIAVAVFALGSVSHGALIANYNFDDGTYNDSSGNNLHASSDNGDPATTSVSGTGTPLDGGQALDLDGDDSISYENATNPGFPTGNSAYSLTTWVRTTSYHDGQFAYWGDYDTDRMNSLASASADYIRHSHYGTDLSISPTNFDDGNWHFLAVTYDADTNNREIYYDSDTPTDSDSQVDPSVVWDSSGFEMGVNEDSSKFFNGQLDDVSVWDHTLSDSEVADIRANGVPEPASLMMLLMLGVFGLMSRRRPRR